MGSKYCKLNSKTAQNNNQRRYMSAKNIQYNSHHYTTPLSANEINPMKSEKASTIIPDANPISILSIRSCDNETLGLKRKKSEDKSKAVRFSEKAYTIDYYVPSGREEQSRRSLRLYNNNTRIIH
jgi:hypothetical protein